MSKSILQLTLLASEVATIFEVAIARNMNMRFMLSQKTVPGPDQIKNKKIIRIKFLTSMPTLLNNEFPKCLVNNFLINSLFFRVLIN